MVVRRSGLQKYYEEQITFNYCNKHKRGQNSVECCHGFGEVISTAQFCESRRFEFKQHDHRIIGL